MVVLKERNDMSMSPKKRSRDKMESNASVKSREKKAKKTAVAKAMSAKKSAKYQSSAAAAKAKSPHRLSGGKQFLPQVASNGGPSHGMAGKGKRLLPQAPMDNDGGGPSHAMAGTSMGKGLIVPENDVHAMDDTVVAKSTGGGGVARPVVALYEQRPFVIKEYTTLDDAKKDLGASGKTIRESEWCIA